VVGVLRRCQQSDTASVAFRCGMTESGRANGRHFLCACKGLNDKDDKRLQRAVQLDMVALLTVLQKWFLFTASEQ